MRNIRVVVIILLVIISAGIAFVVTTKPASVTNPPNPVACTEEAKLCPDGSYVGRTGPQCQFSACPTNTTSGISGTVLLGPSCPVMRNPPDPQCADKPYRAALVVTTLDGSSVIAQFNSDTAGKFKVSVPPGEYVIRSAPTGNFYPHCNSNSNVIVKASAFTNTAVSCDTGIR